MPDGSILPIVRYKEPVAAARWLCRAYGFRIQHEANGPSGDVAHVVLRHGDDFVLIGPLHGTVFDDWMVQPIEVGNRSTQAFYVTVADVDAHCADARKAGARVEMEPCNDDGGRFYLCRDPEGHLWSFGNAPHGAKLARSRPSSVIREEHRALGSRAVVGLAVAVGLAVGGSAALYFGAEPTAHAMVSWIGVAQRAGQAAHDGSAQALLERDRRVEAERLAAFATERLASAEAARAELKDMLDASQLHLAETLRQQQAADQALYISEMAHAEQLKDNRKALDAVALAKNQALQALRVEQQRGVDLQKAYDDAAQQLADAHRTSALLARDSESASVELERLQGASLSAEQAVEQATARLIAAQNAEMRLRGNLESAERQLGALRSRAADLEAQLKVSKVGAETAAQTAKGALAAAHANERVLREKLNAIEMELAELQSARGSKADRASPPEAVQRSRSGARERGQLSRAGAQRSIPATVVEDRALREFQKRYWGPGS